jgi:hypothetical protein
VRRFIVIPVLTLLFGLAAATPPPAPLPPKVVVNHETQQCAYIMGGDECMDCYPPEGWEVLGYSFEAECPAGYEEVQIGETCVALRDRFCCTEGHSGVHGDCDDLLVNNRKKQCAFVEDAETCQSPRGWEKKPPDETYWACPYPENNETWVTDLDCSGEDGSSGRPFLRTCSAIPGLLLSIGLVVTYKRQSVP